MDRVRDLGRLEVESEKHDRQVHEGPIEAQARTDERAAGATAQSGWMNSHGKASVVHHDKSRTHRLALVDHGRRQLGTQTGRCGMRRPD